VTSSLDDKPYDVVDELARIAKELDSTVSRVALAWVAIRPGVTSTILGARTMQQLDDNLAAADVSLTAAHIAKLDTLSTPQLPFPVNMLAMGATIVNGGTTINGRSAPAWPMTPANDAERY
jgi:diketogulonate reductase-like aldo/keto reductase